MTWAGTNESWCEECFSKIEDTLLGCDMCEEIASHKWEELRSSMKKLDIGAIYQFIGSYDGRNELPSNSELRSILGGVNELVVCIAKLKTNMEKRGHYFDD